jgi:hypoxanthine phosphoribosyltransferase
MALKISNKLVLSWDDINDLTDDLCSKIPTHTPHINSVTGLARGGLIPAVMISHKLGLPYVHSINANTLVIDDICDSGVTLRDGIGVNTAVLYYKPHTSCFTPNVWAYTHKGDEWVIFPWEKTDSKQIQDYKLNK